MAYDSIQINHGSYTPTLFNVTNIAASTAYVCQYMRVGNTVTVSGKVDIDTTLSASTLSELGVSLPIASNFASTEQCAGAGAAAVVASQTLEIKADTANDRASLTFLSLSLSNDTWYFTFSYKII